MPLTAPAIIIAITAVALIAASGAAPCHADDARPDPSPQAGAVIRLGEPRHGLADVAVSPAGDTVATGGSDGAVRLWRADTGKLHGALEADAGTGAAYAVAFSPDGTRLAAGHADGIVRLWDPATARLARRIRGHPREVRTVAFSPDGRMLATGGVDGAICLWDAHGELLRQFLPVVAQPDPRRPVAPVSRLAFSPDGAMLASVHDRFDPFVHIWDPQTGRAITHLREDGHGGQALFFSPDGATLVTASSSGQRMTLWETATWRVRRRLDCRGAPELPCAISLDGRSLWSMTGTDVYEWDLSTGRRLRQFSGEHRGPVTAVALFPTGVNVVSASEDGVAVIWNRRNSSRDQQAKPNAPAEIRPEGLWGALAAEDASAAYDAIWALVTAPEQSVPYLRNRLPREARIDRDQVRRLLDDLDGDHFRVRERATKELAALGDAAEPFLRHRRRATRSPEVVQRVEVLLESIRQGVNDAETIRALRAAEVLERIGTPRAKAGLEDLAKRGPGARLKARASAALRRLDRLAAQASQ